MDTQSLNSSWVVVEDNQDMTGSGKEENPNRKSVIQVDAEIIDSRVIEREEVVNIDDPIEDPVEIISDPVINRIKPDPVMNRIKPDPATNSLVILTPKKLGSQIFLTPVRRSKRKIINGLKEGKIRMNDGSIKVQETGQPYISLVECFKQLQKTPRTRRESIDVIVQKYLRK